MLNKCDFIVLDFETVGEVKDQAKDPTVAIPASVCAKAYNCRTLEEYPSGEFFSYFRPQDADKLTEESLNFVRISRETLQAAPLPEVVWGQLQEFVLRYNPERNKWTAPILAGQNVRSYDKTIVKRLNELYLPKKGPKSILFNEFRELELLDVAFLWCENTDDLQNYKLKTLLEFFKIPFDEGKLHDAKYDVQCTGALLMKLLAFQRKLYLKHKSQFNIAK